jgi:hypothetical protein
MCLFIEAAIQLPHGNGFGIEDVRMYLVETLFLAECGETATEHLVVRGFATTRGPHQHETVPHLNCVIELQELVYEGLDGLQEHLLALAAHLRHKCSIIVLGSLNAWKEITDDVLKEWQIVLQELRHVDVT